MRSQETGSAITNWYYSFEWEDWFRHLWWGNHKEHEIKESGVVCGPSCSSVFWVLTIKVESPDSSKAWAWYWACAKTCFSFPSPYSPALGPGQMQPHHRHRVSPAPWVQPGFPVPPQLQGEALHGANGQLFHIPCLKTSPVFVIIAYVLGCKQQGTLSSALDVLSPF